MLRTTAVILSLALGVAGCTRTAPEPKPDAVEAPRDDRASPAPEGGASGGSPSPEEDQGGGGHGTKDDASQDDLAVFAYATTDEAALATDLAVMAEVIAQLDSHLRSRDLDAAEADATTLLSQAERLEADASAARDRQQPLEPGDPELVDAREAALAAFGLTGDYASAATSVAEATLELDLSQLASVLRDAAELAGTSDDLTQAYADLNAALTWAQAKTAG